MRDYVDNLPIVEVIQLFREYEALEYQKEKSLAFILRHIDRFRIQKGLPDVQLELLMVHALRQDVNHRLARMFISTIDSV